MRPNRQELEGRIAVSPSVNAVDTFAAPSQRPVVQREQTDLGALVDLSSTLQRALGAEAKVIQAQEADIAAELARRESKGEAFGQIVKDLLGTEGTPNQTKAKLVRMQRDGKISPTETPVFLGLYENAKIDIVTARAKEAINRRATDVVLAGRKAARLYADTDQADEQVRKFMQAQIDEIIQDELGDVFDGLSDTSIGKLELSLEGAAADLETNAYIMLQNEMEQDLISTQTQGWVSTLGEIRENLDGDGSYSVDVNAAPAMRQGLQSTLEVYLNSGVKDPYAAFEEGAVRNAVQQLEQVDDPVERQEALEALQEAVGQLTGPGGTKPYTGATKRTTRTQQMVVPAIERARRAQRADQELNRTVKAEQYIEDTLPPELLYKTDLSQEEAEQLRDLVDNAPVGTQGLVRERVKQMRNFADTIGGTGGPETGESSARLEVLRANIERPGEQRAELRELLDEKGEAAVLTVLRGPQYGLSAAGAGTALADLVRGRGKDEDSAIMWLQQSSKVIDMALEGRPVLTQGEGGVLQMEPGAKRPDFAFKAELKNEFNSNAPDSLRMQLQQRIAAGEVSQLQAANEMLQAVDQRITERQEVDAIDNRVVDQNVTNRVTELRAEMVKQSAAQEMYAAVEGVEIPNRFVDLPGSAFSPQYRARQRATAVGAIVGYDNLEGNLAGARDLEFQGTEQKQAEQQSVRYANGLLYDVITKSDAGAHLANGRLSPDMMLSFRSRLNSAMGLGTAKWSKKSDANLPLSNLFQRMAEDSEVLDFVDGELVVKYNQLNLGALYNPASTPVSDERLTAMGVVPADAKSPRASFSLLVNGSLLDLERFGLNASQITKYTPGQFNYREFTVLSRAQVNGKARNPLLQHVADTADLLFEVKRPGFKFDPTNTEHIETYGVIVSHIFSQLRALKAQQ